MSDRSQTIRIPPNGTRGTSMPFAGALGKLFKPVINMQIARYRRSTSPSPPVMMGFPTVLLTTTGSRSGLERTSVLGGFPDGEEAWLLVASKSGARTHPAWFINLARSPDKVWLEVGPLKFKAKVESLQGAAREAALERVAAVSPRYAGYQRKTDREIPVMRVKPAV
ncbi:MAG: nitroreductase/quinone reductase family protein [Candidatus Dormibacterales bacterium]